MSGTEVFAILCGCATWAILTVSYAGFAAACANRVDLCLLILQSCLLMLSADYRRVCKDRPRLASSLALCGFGAVCLVVHLWDHGHPCLPSESRTPPTSPSLVRVLLQTDRNVEEKVTVVSDKLTWLEAMQELDWLGLLAYLSKRGITLLLSFGVQLGLYSPVLNTPERRRARQDNSVSESSPQAAGRYSELTTLGLQRHSIQHRGIVVEETVGSIDNDEAVQQSAWYTDSTHSAPDVSALGLQKSMIRRRGVVVDTSVSTSGKNSFKTSIDQDMRQTAWHSDADRPATDLSVLGFQRSTVRRRGVVESIEAVPTDESNAKTTWYSDKAAPKANVPGFQQAVIRHRGIVEEDPELEPTSARGGSKMDSPRHIAQHVLHPDATSVATNHLSTLAKSKEPPSDRFDSQKSMWHVNVKELAPDVSALGLQRKSMVQRGVLSDPEAPDTSARITKTNQPMSATVPFTGLTTLGFQRQTTRQKGVALSSDDSCDDLDQCKARVCPGGDDCIEGASLLGFQRASSRRKAHLVTDDE